MLTNPAALAAILNCNTCTHHRDVHPASVAEDGVHDPCTVCGCPAFTSVDCTAAAVGDANPTDTAPSTP